MGLQRQALFFSFSLFSLLVVSAVAPVTDLDMEVKLERYLIPNHGFHRVLTTQVNLTSTEIDRYFARFIKPEDNTSKNCTVMLVESFTEHLYLDRFELEDRERIAASRNEAVPHVHFFRDMDLEKPAYSSPSNVVLVYYSFDPSSTASRLFNVSIPVHFRYQPPSEPFSDHPYNYNIIDPPMTFLFCDQKPPLPNPKPPYYPEGREWVRLRHQGDFLTNIESESKELRIMVQLPTGLFSHATLINALTAIFTVSGAAVISFLVYREATRPPNQDRRGTEKAIDRMEKQKGNTVLKEAVVRPDLRNKPNSLTQKSARSTPQKTHHNPGQKKSPSSSSESKGKKAMVPKSKKF